MNRWELEQKIVLRALKDPSFKKQLQSQPKEAVRAFLKNEKGIDLTHFDMLHVKVVEEKKEEWVLALPSTEGLSEEQLDKLAAGSIYSWDYWSPFG